MLKVENNEVMAKLQQSAAFNQLNMLQGYEGIWI
jgi:hypothetical protein